MSARSARSTWLTCSSARSTPTCIFVASASRPSTERGSPCRSASGYAAILGGLLWLLVLVGNAINNGGDAFSPWLGYAVVVATAMTLIALIGLSAFQARRYPVLTWAAFAIPGLGAVLGLVGYAAIVVTGDSDALLVGGISPWMLASVGLITMVLGSVLFAIATWRTQTLSRTAAALLAVGGVLVVVALLGVGSGGLSLPAAAVPVIAAIIVFPGGWIALGISALRVTGPAPITAR